MSKEEAGRRSTLFLIKGYIFSLSFFLFFFFFKLPREKEIFSTDRLASGQKGKREEIQFSVARGGQGYAIIICARPWKY